MLGCLLTDFSRKLGPVDSHNPPARFGAIRKARNDMFQASRFGIFHRISTLGPKESSQIFKIPKVRNFSKMWVLGKFLKHFLQILRNVGKIRSANHPKSIRGRTLCLSIRGFPAVHTILSRSVRIAWRVSFGNSQLYSHLELRFLSLARVLVNWFFGKWGLEGSHNLPARFGAI